eukprot:GHVT01011133.1.p1 GENE.GHVT01011133.1~~GHVT01011133.1.p1  ORF type:complete len:118 (-),score=17.47 GHVT01011133.1:599-952(-)
MPAMHSFVSFIFISLKSLGSAETSKSFSVNPSPLAALNKLMQMLQREQQTLFLDFLISSKASAATGPQAMKRVTLPPAARNLLPSRLPRARWFGTRTTTDARPLLRRLISISSSSSF